MNRTRRALVNAVLAASLAAPNASAAAELSRLFGSTQDTLPSLRAGNVFLHYWPGNERLAQRMLAPPGVLAPLPGLPPDMLDEPPPIDVFLTPDAARFDSLTGGRTPDWGAGVALPDAGVIILPGYASERAPTADLPRVLRHELAHIALHRYLGPVQVPRWFSEGYATWAAGQLDADAAWLLRVAFVTQRAPPLDSLALEWPRGQIDARVAYLLSASAVEYMYRNGGERALRAFLVRWRETGDFDRAVRDTYGLTIGQLERYWSRSVRRQYGWLLFLAQSVALWSIAAAVVIALFMLRKRRNRARLARLRAAEIPDRPAYWLGEEDRRAEDGSQEGGAPERGEERK
ncbi:MAG: peptidase MA family metallohydrolase [Longimicrobiales bacterium]